MTDKKAHSDFGGSVAEKWINCHGYYHAVKNLPEQADTFDTVWGTAVHALNEHILRTGDSLNDWIDRPWIGKIPVNFKGNTYTEDDIPAVRQWCDAVSDMTDPLSDRVLMEESVVMSSISSEIYGSADLIAFNRDEKLLLVLDYKNGSGKKVDLSTPQLPFYAVAADDTYGLGVDKNWKVVVGVVQPRIYSEPQILEMRGDMLQEWRGVFRHAYIRAQNENAPRIPGSHCHWCKAASNCHARVAHGQTLARSAFGGVTSANQLTPEQRGRVLRIAPILEAIIDDVRTISLEKARNGTPDPGTMLTTGRKGNRKWSDESAVAQALEQRFKDKAYTKKLISPSDAEKLTGKGKLAELEQFIVQEPGKPALTLDDVGKLPFDPNDAARLDFLPTST